MFPPRQAQTAEEVLRDVIDSLRRAGLEVLDDVLVLEDKYRFTCPTALSKEERKMLSDYIVRYSATAGWEANVEFQRPPCRAFVISLAKSLSSSEKNI